MTGHFLFPARYTAYSRTGSRMISTFRLSRILWTIVALILLNATFIHADNAPSPVLPDQLGGAERYLAYVSTDKPMYREGENVYIRTVVLNARDNTPSQARNNVIFVSITGPKGDLVHEGHSNGTDSVIGYQWRIPSGIVGGQYTAKITSPTHGVPESTRTFDIRAYRAPRIKTQIEFTRDGYGPGDLIKAGATIERAEGGIPVNATITAIARLDGEEIYRSQALDISDSGVVATAFTLPDHITSGEGSLSFVIEDGGVVETSAKSLPILLQDVEISFYPESGELVAGLQSRVYFQALLPNGKPADVQGNIVVLDGTTPGDETIATFTSEHEGRGLFEFTPAKGKRYAAVFTAPSGIVQPAELPDVKTTGTVITSTQAAFAFNEPIELSVNSSNANPPARITLHKREALLDSQAISSNTQKLDAKDAEGVLIATAWDTNGHPLAERLIYRHSRFGLNIELTLSDEPFVPGGTVSVEILTTDDQGKPVEAVVGLTVTDDTVLELIEKRQQAPRLPAMVYLENEVLDLADAHVYLDDTNQHAAKSIDLLLGTQGWRRFILVNYADMKTQFPSAAAQAMAENTPLRDDTMIRKGAMPNDMQFALPMVAEQMIIADAPERIEQPEHMALAHDKDITPEAQAIKQFNIAQEEAADAGRVAEIVAMDIAPDAVMAKMARQMAGGYIREFAFQARASRQPNERIDFTETLYWNSGVKTGARNGRATVDFSLSDSVTTFRLLADGYGRNGALGTGNAVIESVEPFYISTKMPLHTVVNDVIELPVTLVNTSTETIKNASLVVSGESIVDMNSSSITLAPGQRLRRTIKVATTQIGSFPITIVAQAGPYTDTVTRNLHVAPKGFPIAVNSGGLLSSTAPFKTTIAIPDTIIDGSVTATAKVYPSPLASMDEALNALLREPHGCFEQTSSTNYPLVMAQQYFDSHTGVDPSLIAKSRDILKTGYGKLVSFESADSGYEWFGANPAHEALTAYGLMQFTDMAKVSPIDDTMIERTRQWLLDRRNGKGGFKRNERALDSFGRAPAPTTDAYIIWALLESGQNPSSLQAEISQIKITAFNGSDSYIHALAANILYLSGDYKSAEILLEKLADASSATGAVEGAITSITGSGGNSLTIETTSLSLLAWLRNDEHWAAQVETSIQWLFERSKAGRFGSTQSTVLALKAINAYDAARAVPSQPGAVQLFINGEEFGEQITFTKDSKGAIELPDFTHTVTPGHIDIELRMSDGSKMPFALDIKYNTALPGNADIRPVRMNTALSHSTITEGEPLELQATITALGHNVPTPIAIIGIPAGLELRHEQLKELIGNGSISAYEVKQSTVVLYWRALKARETRVIPIGLIAQIPGNYTGPASRIYPYYTDEQKDWSAGHSIEVVAR